MLPAGDFQVGKPVEFSVVLTNHTAKAYSSLDPMVQFITASGAAFNGTLERFDPAAHNWRTIPILGADTAPVGAASATPFTLTSHGTMTIRYRLTVAPDQPVQQTDAMFYAIGSDGHQLGLATGVLRTTTH